MSESFFDILFNKTLLILAKLDSLCVSYSYFPKQSNGKTLHDKHSNRQESFPYHQEISTMESPLTHNSNPLLTHLSSNHSLNNGTVFVDQANSSDSSFFMQQDSIQQNLLQQATLKPNTTHLIRILSLMQQKAFFLGNHSNVTKPKISSLLRYVTLPLHRKIRIISLDRIQHKELIIKRTELREQRGNILSNTFFLAKAKQIKIPTATHECQFVLKNMDKDYAYFEVFFVDSYKLCKEVLFSQNKLYFLNPIDILGKLSILFPHLTYYTVIIQDKEKHALAHYSHGALIFCVIVEKKIALQNYYHHIHSLGEIIACDLHDSSLQIGNFISIQTLLSQSFTVDSLSDNQCFKEMDLQTYLKVLAINYCYSSNLLSLKKTFFTPKHLYALQYKVFACCMIGILLLLANFIYVLYLDYEYKDFLNEKQAHYYETIQMYYEKKKTYPSIYHKIYDNLIEQKSLNFSIEQHYNYQAKQWE